MKVRTSNGQQAPVFRFCVVADTHVNESESGGSSPFVTNASANAKARHVFHEIAGMDPAPDFVVHIGDIVHPVPSLPGFDDAVNHFRDMTAGLPMPLHVIPGNHDVGDKHIDWMPADLVCESYLDTYRAAFGADYYAFDRDGCRFIMLNSVLFNSQLPQDQQQRDWLVEQLNSAEKSRVFVFLHYPPYIHSPDERGNYDNIDQPGRAWLIEKLSRPGVEAIFAGHVHNFWYDRLGTAEMYMLPSTAFMRHDFSEFYKIAPEIEFARGDSGRYGYFLVEVFANGHVAYSLRTGGEQLAPNEQSHAREQVALAHPKVSPVDRLGVELRHPWAETMQIAATGGVQEFGRKWARNDYPLQALWEMGLKLCKVPDLDLAEQTSSARMQVLAGIGHHFLVTTLGAPKPHLLEKDAQQHGVLGYEVNATLDTLARQRDDLIRIRREHNCAIYFAKILSSESKDRFDGQHFTHFVKSGFALNELAPNRELIANALADGVIDGVSVRLDFGEDLLAGALQINQFASEMNCQVLVSLKLAGPSVAQEQADDLTVLLRLAQAFVLSMTQPGVRYVFDTFMDVDRGYYPRHALIDRRFNPRMAGLGCAFMAAHWPTGATVSIESVSDNVLGFSINGEHHELLLASGPDLQARVSGSAGRQAWDLCQCEVIDTQALVNELVGSGRQIVVLT